MWRRKWLPVLEILIDRILHFSFFLSPLPFSVFFSLSLNSSTSFLLFLFLSFRSTVETHLDLIIAFHFRDELSRSIRAWHKCNVKKVRGHPRLRLRARVKEKNAESARTWSAIWRCEFSHRARPCYKIPIMRVKWRIRRQDSSGEFWDSIERRGINFFFFFIKMWEYWVHEISMQLCLSCKKYITDTLHVIAARVQVLWFLLTKSKTRFACFYLEGICVTYSYVLSQ